MTLQYEALKSKRNIIPLTDLKVKTKNESEDFMYKIIRFYFNGRKKFIKIVSSLEIAQLHCKDKRTLKSGIYFDGYIKV